LQGAGEVGGQRVDLFCLGDGVVQFLVGDGLVAVDLPDDLNEIVGLRFLP
jgi:hypothetical protein